MLQNKRSGAQNLTVHALLIALALVVFTFESMLPRPLPWAKPGLANIATLLALYMFGMRSALVVVAGRVIVGSLILGTLFSPLFLFSLTGGLAAALAMGLVRHTRIPFTVIGISLVGSLTHNLVQLLLADLLIVRHAAILRLFPMIWIPAIFSGLVIGLLSLFILRSVRFEK